MKNIFKFLGIIALVAIIGFGFIACGDGGDDGTVPGGTTPGGTTPGGDENNNNNNNGNDNTIGSENQTGNDNGDPSEETPPAPDTRVELTAGSAVN